MANHDGSPTDIMIRRVGKLIPKIIYGESRWNLPTLHYAYA